MVLTHICYNKLIHNWENGRLKINLDLVPLVPFVTSGGELSQSFAISLVSCPFLSGILYMSSPGLPLCLVRMGRIWNFSHILPGRDVIRWASPCRSHRHRGHTLQSFCFVKFNRLSNVSDFIL